MKYRPKHIAEYLLLRAFMLPIAVLPYRVALAFGAGLAWLAHFVFRFRTDEARIRIKEVFGERYADTEIKKLAWHAMRDTAFHFVEHVRMPKINEAWLKKHAPSVFPLHKELEEIRKDKPIILAVVHMGNWDLAGVGLEVLGMPSFFIMREQRNPLTNNFINKMRTVRGSQVIERDDRKLYHKVIAYLKSGMTMAILVDLRSATPAMDAQFLGQPANIATGVGRMAKQADAIVVPCAVLRHGWTQHEWKVLDPIYPDPELSKKEDGNRITQLALNQLSEQVLKRPDLFFWFNKRWVLQPLDSQ